MRKRVTDFAKLIDKFFDDYLPIQRDLSENTLASYAQSIKFFATYLHEMTGDIDSVTMSKITRDTVLNFLNEFTEKEKWKPPTRNNRLSALNAFFWFSAKEDPRHLLKSQQIRTIARRKEEEEIPPYLSPSGLELLLKQPDQKRLHGRRHFMMLSLMYDSGARVSELIKLTPSDILFSNRRTKLRLVGKGKRVRTVPISKAVVKHLKKYLKEMQLDDTLDSRKVIFPNSSGDPMTRGGFYTLFRKYAAMAREQDKSIPEDLHPHSLRHTKAIHLIDVLGWSLLAVMRFLGHKSAKTTMRYLNFTNQKKDEILQKRADKLLGGILPSVLPLRREKQGIINFLNSKLRS